MHCATIQLRSHSIVCVVFNNSVPPTTQKCECDTKRIRGGEGQTEEPNGTEDGENLLDVR
jgi:hypothetical protein